MVTVNNHNYKHYNHNNKHNLNYKYVLQCIIYKLCKKEK